MSEPLKVDTRDLLDAGARAAWQADDVAIGHAHADARIENAGDGWVGSSASALADALERWRATTAALVGRLDEHADRFTAGAAVYADSDHRGAAELSRPDRGNGGAAG